MASSKPFVLSSFKGGMNSFDPPMHLSEDQVVLAYNVEFVGATCGDRRLGHTAITLSSDVTALDGVWAMHRHLPSTDEADAELWVLAATVNSSAILSYKSGTTWTTVALTDTPDTSAAALAQYQFQSFHGKLYLAYPSSVDRLHVWDGTTFRRVGLAPPAAGPTAVEDGAAAPTGGYDGVRYFRVRFTVQDSGVTLLRSEPSAEFTLTTDSTHATAIVTRPALINEGETHWELEASLNRGDWYRIGTTAVATTTFVDAVPFGVGYAVGIPGAIEPGVLSEEIGAYTVPPSAKLITVDNDRLVLGGNWEDEALSANVIWTPVFLDPGVGNDERIALQTDPSVTLDGFEGGAISNLLANNGLVYATKTSQTYRLVRTNLVEKAYEADQISPIIGGVAGSMVAGLEPSGNPAVYAIDRNIGPFLIGTGGLLTCGRDIRPVWDTHSGSSTLPVLVRGVFYSTNRQVRWVFTEEGSTGTTKGLTLHVDEMQLGPQGYTRGWTVFTGTAVTGVTDMIVYSDNVDTGTDHSIRLVPLVSRIHASKRNVLIGESGIDDDGTAYVAQITSRPFLLGSGSQKFGVRAAALVAGASDATISFTLIRDFGLEGVQVPDIDLSTTIGEHHVMPLLDNACLSDCLALHVALSDPVSQTDTWHIHQIALIPSPEGKQ